MSEPTLLVSPLELGSARLRVEGEDFRHLFRARRLEQGSRLRLVDGEGGAAWGHVDSVGDREAVLLIDGPAPSLEPRHTLELWVALPRPQRAAWLVEKATELGVSAVCWTTSSRAPRQLSESGLARLRRVARAALEQCGRSRLPEISGPHSWTEALEAVEGSAAAFILTPQAAIGGPTADSNRAVLLIGPEGGFSGAEQHAAEQRGARPLGLGPRILRVETAALAAAALCLAAGPPDEGAGDL